MNLNTIRALIPFIFAAIILGFIAKLGVDNSQLRNRNEQLQKDSRQLSVKNDDLANTLQNLTDAVTEMNKLVGTEAKRRAAAEMKSQKLQEEVKYALKDNRCSIALIPADAVVGVHKAADSARAGKGSDAADTSQPAK